MQLCCYRHQKYELEQRQSSGFYRAKAYDKMKYRTRDGPWVQCSYKQLYDIITVINTLVCQKADSD